MTSASRTRWSRPLAGPSHTRKTLATTLSPSLVVEIAEVHHGVPRDRIPEISGVRGRNDLVAFADPGDQVQQLALPDRVLVQFQLIDQHDGLVHVFGDHANQEQ